jgi:hypothetical protein
MLGKHALHLFRVNPRLSVGLPRVARCAVSQTRTCVAALNFILACSNTGSGLMPRHPSGGLQRARQVQVTRV